MAAFAIRILVSDTSTPVFVKLLWLQALFPLFSMWCVLIFLVSGSRTRTESSSMLYKWQMIAYNGFPHYKTQGTTAGWQCLCSFFQLSTISSISWYSHSIEFPQQLYSISCHLFHSNHSLLLPLKRFWRSLVEWVFCCWPSMAEHMEISGDSWSLKTL